LERFLHNVRHAARALRKRPQYSIVVVLTLAIAIGANTVIFSFVNAVLLRPLPFPKSSRLVLLQSKKAGEFGRVSLTDLEDLTEQSTLLEGLSGFRNSQYIVTSTGAPEEITECVCTSTLFDTLGIRATLGTVWPPEYDRSTVREAMISYEFWKRYFSSDMSVIGKKVDLDSMSYGIIGVLPPSFVFPVKADIYEHTYPGAHLDRGGRNFIGIGRLKPGATLHQAEAELKGISNRLMNTFPTTNAGIEFSVRPMRSYWLGNAGDYLIVLLLAGGFVLLIAGVNVVNLILFEFFSRDKEIAIKIALGAPRAGLIRQLLIESTMLGVVGGAIGLLLEFWGAPILNSRIGVELPPWMRNEFNLTVLAFSVIVSIVTGLLAGLVPAFRVTRPDLSLVLKEGAKGSSGSLLKRNYSRLLIIAEVALAVSLVTCAGLMIKSFLFLQSEDLGFKPNSIFSVRIDPPDNIFGKVAQTGPLYKRILEELQSLPNVQRAAADHALPLANETAEEFTTRVLFTIEGQGTAEQDGNPYGVYQNVSPGYFEAMSIPILRGRDFNSEDSEGSPKVAIISQRLADYFWPSQDPIGKRLKLGRADSNRPWLTIIGIAGNVKRRSIQEMAGLDIYVSDQQFFVGDSFLIVRLNSNQANLVQDVTEAVWRVDPRLAVFDVAPMQERVLNTVWQQRLTCALLIAFAMLALALASVGIYGVFSNHVLQRTRELGIRLALGAQRRDILRMVLSEAMKSIAVGIAVGLLASLLLTRLISGLLFKVSPHDTAVLLGAPCLLVFTAIMASLIPAWRATEADPIIALRTE
jgi:putative ABC transport system permease protein